MAETLGMLCDKLTIVKLKQYHSDDSAKLKSLETQAFQLQEEIDYFISNAIKGIIPQDRLTFSANKVFAKTGNETPETGATISAAFSQLADVNCRLWHEVEKGYEIEKVAEGDKNALIKMLAVLNLERNNCIDAIDLYFKELIVSKKS